MFISKNINQKKIETKYGRLLVWENLTSDLGFCVERIFIIDEVPPEGRRGGHAHRQCIQAILCLSGSVEISLESREGASKFRMSCSTGIIVIPPLTWLDLEKFENSNTSLLVFASHNYDENDYIRNYDKFKLLSKVN